MTCSNCGDESTGKFCKACSATKSNIRYHKRQVKELEETLAMAAKNGRKNNGKV